MIKSDKEHEWSQKEEGKERRHLLLEEGRESQQQDRDAAVVAVIIIVVVFVVVYRRRKGVTGSDIAVGYASTHPRVALRRIAYVIVFEHIRVTASAPHRRLVFSTCLSGSAERESRTDERSTRRARRSAPTASEVTLRRQPSARSGAPNTAYARRATTCASESESGARSRSVRAWRSSE